MTRRAARWWPVPVVLLVGVVYGRAAGAATVVAIVGVWAYRRVGGQRRERPDVIEIAPQDGWTYLVCAPAVGLHKIGFTDRPDVHARFGEIEARSAAATVPVAWCPGGRPFEGELHALYAHRRVTAKGMEGETEWFMLTDTETAEVRDMMRARWGQGVGQ